MRRHEGAHPCVGSLDVCPVVWTAAEDREAAEAEALGVAQAIAAEGVPVFLYGSVASEPVREERSYFRNGGLEALRERMATSGLRADFGPVEPHTTAGATLVTARPPLAAFNVLLEGGDIDGAREMAEMLREAGGGLPGVRAIAVDLGEAGLQISTNVHDPVSVPLAAVVERIGELGEPFGARPAAGEVVGLVPEAALEGLPEELTLPGFDPEVHVLEKRVGREVQGG
jgi:glutamate formiminotransferase